MNLETAFRTNNPKGLNEDEAAIFAAYIADFHAAGEVDLKGKVAAEARDAAPRPLYIRRDVLNGAEIVAWAKRNGFTKALPVDDLHVTILYCRDPVDWMALPPPWEGELTIPAGGPRIMERFGEGEDARVLTFKSSELEWRSKALAEAGAAHSYTPFKPHITLSYESGLDGEEASWPMGYPGEIKLGPEIWEPIDEEWKASITEDNDQPRAPAGQSNGGQWVKGGSGSGTAKAVSVGVTKIKGGPVTEDELSALDDYMEFAAEINTGLRQDSLGRRHEDTVESLDNLISRGALSDGIDLYRGLTPEAVAAINPEAGKTFSDKAFVSTSRSKRRAEEFSEDSRTGEMGYVMRVYARKGQPALDAAAITGDSFEQEVLLPRGQLFRVIEVNHHRKTLYVHAVTS